MDNLNDVSMLDINNKSTLELFTMIKESCQYTSYNDLNELSDNIIVSIIGAYKNNQKFLLEKLKFIYSNIEKERKLRDYDIFKFILKDELSYIIDSLDIDNKHNIFFIELEDYPRVIPNEVSQLIQKLNSDNIFDKYYVLYTDYSKKSVDKSNNKSKPKIEKDPILFGAFSKTIYYNNKKIPLISDRIYIISDWTDEYCDITVDKLMRYSRDNINYTAYNEDRDYDTFNYIMNLPDELSSKKSSKSLFYRIKNKFTRKQ